MAGKLTITTLRLTEDVLARADALIAQLASTPEFAAVGEVTRAHVLRFALVRGLEQLEGEHSKKRKR